MAPRPSRGRSGPAPPLSRTIFAIACVCASSAQAQLCQPPSAAAASGWDLHCLKLIPEPGVDTASGYVHLGQPAGPFTIAVAANGSPIYSPDVVITGLPAPSTLGAYTRYVAWVSPSTMYPVHALGTVSNGHTAVDPITIDPFVVLISAEGETLGPEPKGRVVLRGASPTTRLMPPDILEFAAGAVAADTMSHDLMADHDLSPQSGVAKIAWTTVPMTPGLSMLPAEMALRPSVKPYLPHASPSTPAATPRRTVVLANGDTLHLTARIVHKTIAGRTFAAFAFNGEYPGPTISVPQGANIVVDYSDSLDQPSTVHWHGIRLDNPFDGVPDLTQAAVAPNGHFIYHVRFPDAGIYWYHSHVREDTQQNLGLYGNILVRSADPHYFSPANREEFLILSDILLNADGPVPYGREAPTHTFMGRFGNVLLINGETRYDLRVKRGEVVRFFLTNVSNTRPYNISFPGARMKIVGSDAGNYEHEEWVNSVVIAPAERYIVQVQFNTPGAVPVLNSVRGLDHLFNRFFIEGDTLGVVHVAPTLATPNLSSSFAVLRTDSAAVADIDHYRSYFDRPPDHALVLTLSTQNLPFVTHQILQIDSVYFNPVEWTGTMPGMNWASTPDQVHWALRDPVTGKENMDIGWTFHRGDVIKLRLVNDRRSLHAMQHPIHLHGQRFLVLSVDGVPNTNLVWKDTVLVPAGSTIDLLVDLSNPGTWMLHCHIAEHLADGMMTAFIVQ